jgi:hypothetical protein
LACCKLNTKTNQPTNQPINQPTNQPTNEPTKQTMGRFNCLIYARVFEGTWLKGFAVLKAQTLMA